MARWETGPKRSRREVPPGNTTHSIHTRYQGVPDRGGFEPRGGPFPERLSDLFGRLRGRPERPPLIEGFFLYT